MARALYDVYDKEGNLFIEEMTSLEIGKALDYSPQYVSKCACDEVYLGNKYKIVKREVEVTGGDSVKSMLLNNWNKITEPFRNIMWVKEDGPGVKTLNGKRG